MKKALLVGINRYPDPSNELKGCVNDVRQMAETLKSRYGFPGDGNMRILTDARATTKAILDGLAWLTAGASPGDSLVFHYSGHGSQVPDKNGDETTDRLDEILCPYDLDWDHPLTDDDLAAACAGVPQGALLTVILDCCHSGTGLRDFAISGNLHSMASLTQTAYLAQSVGSHPQGEFRPPLRRPAVRRPRPEPLPPASGNGASRFGAPPPPGPPVRRQRHEDKRRPHRRLPGRPDLGRRLDRRRLPRRPHVLPLPRSFQRRPRPHLSRPRLRHRRPPSPAPASTRSPNSRAPPTCSSIRHSSRSLLQAMSGAPFDGSSQPFPADESRIGGPSGTRHSRGVGPASLGASTSSAAGCGGP